MKRQRSYLLLLLAATLAVAACTGVDDSAATEPAIPAEPQAVAFDAYLNRGTTRGGATGTLTTDGTSSTTSLQTEGFGVFAYYTDNHLYNQLSLPNFMYNQQVIYNSSAWTYTPVKYWPNETGSTAASDGTDHLSFFAYAPYTAVDAATGCVADDPNTTGINESQTGIVALSRTKDSGDPIVRYYASLKPAEAVDLCWATPHIDETKPAVASTVSFSFQHALAALNVQIDADIDVVGHAASALDANTRIYVRSITFRGFADRGQLNLNNTNTTPRWNNLDCDCDLTSDPITIYDGRRDGREGIAASLNELKVGLNPAIVQSGAYTIASVEPVFNSTTSGVTNTPVNLFDVSGMTSATDEQKRQAPIFVIPTSEPLYITIVYDVETYDHKLTSQYLSDGRTHGSTIENTISAYIQNGSSQDITMQAGKQYTISLHLGMTSVKVDATVTAWPIEGIEATVEVPK